MKSLAELMLRLNWILFTGFRMTGQTEMQSILPLSYDHCFLLSVGLSHTISIKYMQFVVATLQNLKGLGAVNKKRASVRLHRLQESS